MDFAHRLNAEVTPDMTFPQAAHQMMRVLLGDGHRVAELIGSRVPLDDLAGAVSTLDATPEAAGVEHELGSAIEEFVSAARAAAPLMIEHIEALSDGVAEAMEAYRAQDGAAAAALDTVQRRLDRHG